MVDESEKQNRIKEHLSCSEVIIAYCELLFLLGISALYFFAPKPTDVASFVEPSIVIFACFYFLVGSRIFISQKLGFSRILIHVYCAMEMILLTLLIYSFHVKYQQSVALSLKAPTFVYYFYFIALQSIRFNPVYIIASALWATGGWLTLSLYAANSNPDLITHSFTEYISSDRILLGAEFEKINALLVVSLTLALGVYRYRKSIVDSMKDLEDAAETLDRKNKDLELWKNQLQTANNIKNQFLTLVSHELRTPLNGILGSIESQNGENTISEDSTNDIRRSAQGLRNTVDGILEFLEYEGGRQASKPEVFSVEELFQKIYDRVQMDLAPGVTWNSSFEEHLRHIKGPAKEFFSCLYIIVDNAVRFTEKGSVSLHLAQEDGLLCLTASDTGGGIPESSLDSIFEAFHQADNSSSRKVEGLGLGLSRLNMIVKLLNGRIKLKSNENGTTIMIGFILDEYYKIAGKPKQVSRSTNLVGFKVMVVEDNPLNMKITKKMLEKIGVEHLSAVNGEEAVKMLEGQQKVDFILMDCQMPIMDGYEATRIIRSQLNMAIPIVALTAHALESDKQKCLDVGMNDHLTKPVSLKQLEEKISLYLSHSPAQQKAN